MTVLGFHTAPPGRESLARTLPQGFTLGYFRLFPPGRTALNASLFPHLELVQVDCWRGSRVVIEGCAVERLEEGWPTVEVSHPFRKKRGKDGAQSVMPAQ
jgi:hypothetical protein